MPEKGVARQKYPWDTMEVTDSFLFSIRIDTGNAKKMCEHHSRDGKKFEWRRVSRDNIRCWRTA